MHLTTKSPYFFLLISVYDEAEHPLFWLILPAWCKWYVAGLQRTCKNDAFFYPKKKNDKETRNRSSATGPPLPSSSSGRSPSGPRCRRSGTCCSAKSPSPRHPPECHAWSSSSVQSPKMLRTGPRRRKFSLNNRVPVLLLAGGVVGLVALGHPLHEHPVGLLLLAPLPVRHDRHVRRRLESRRAPHHLPKRQRQTTVGKWGE